VTFVLLSGFGGVNVVPGFAGADPLVHLVLLKLRISRAECPSGSS
jgi:hypothetical protein